MGLATAALGLGQTDKTAFCILRGGISLEQEQHLRVRKPESLYSHLSRVLLLLLVCPLECFLKVSFSKLDHHVSQC